MIEFSAMVLFANSLYWLIRALDKRDWECAVLGVCSALGTAFLLAVSLGLVKK